MQFIYPGFLFALSALAIPVIIHLFNFRKFKRIYFTNVKFLKEIKQETQSKSQLKHLLVLLARMLALLFLVVAFAQPYIPLAKTAHVGGDKVVSIFIDNSFSMDALGKAGTLLDQAKKSAQEIVAAYQPADRFQLLTNDFEGRHQRLVNKEEFLEALQEVKSSAMVKSAAEIYSRQLDLLNNSGLTNKSIYLISDFQKSNYNLNEIKNDSSVRVTLLPLEGISKNNLFVDSCWFETPSRQLNKAEVLNVRVCNASDVSVENAPIKLFINKQQKALASFSLEANTTEIVKLTFTSKEIGIQSAHLQLTDYPVTFDDSYYFSFDVARKIAVLSINQDQESNSLNTLFKNDSAFLLSNAPEKNIDYAALSGYNLIVLNELKSISTGLAQELKRFVNNGGSVLIFPAKEIDLAAYQTFLTSVTSNYYTTSDTVNTRVDKINLQHPIYNDVFDKKKRASETIDLPNVLTHYVLNSASRSNLEYLMRMQNGDVFLSKNNFGKGQVYLSAVPLDGAFSNFTKHAIFVPSLYKIALFSVAPKKLFYTIGLDEPIDIAASSAGADEVFHLKSSSKNFDLVPELKVMESGSKIFLHNRLQYADNYLLTAGAVSLQGLGFNYDRKESNLICFDNEALEEQISKPGFANFSILSEGVKDITSSLKELDQGKRYWKWCIFLALIFLASEIALIRFWK